jgi:hypothetical protein
MLTVVFVGLIALFVWMGMWRGELRTTPHGASWYAARIVQVPVGPGVTCYIYPPTSISCLKITDDE